MNDYLIDFSKDMNEVWIVPNKGIPINNFVFILEFIEKLGYKYWLPASERGDYRFAKEIK